MKPHHMCVYKYRYLTDLSSQVQTLTRYTYCLHHLYLPSLVYQELFSGLLLETRDSVCGKIDE